MAINIVGDSQTFNYTGSMQSFTLTTSGIYKLEVWGARGGTTYGFSNTTYGKGGYSVGYKILNAGTTLYICVGGMGGYGGWGVSAVGGYNGGGNSTAYDSGNPYTYVGGGGGATHIALVNGTIQSIGKTTFDQQGLIVAGGGGGNAHFNDNNNRSYVGGGNGGGTSGSVGVLVETWGSGATYSLGSGGTQSTGYAFGKGGTSSRGSGGGGGYYGGFSSGAGCVGGGGSGWIGGVPSITYGGITYEPSMTNGSRNSNGVAKLTLMGILCCIKVNGSWLSGTPYVKDNGTWKVGSLYTKDNGTWK